MMTYLEEKKSIIFKKDIFKSVCLKVSPMNTLLLIPRDVGIVVENANKT